MNPSQIDNKWDPLIEQINQTEALPEKLNLLATMVKMIAVNDLACMEDSLTTLSRKFDSCMKRIYIVGVVIAIMVFTGIEVRTVINLILRIIK